VVKVAVVYAGVAFVIVQTADLVFRGLVLPEWTYTLLVVFALFGFPIALVLAWAFDVTSEGVRRTEPLGAVAAAPATAPARRPGGPPADGDGPAIVVLPFQNLSADPEDEYFTEGVTEDITARIAALQGVRVISRTSAARYRGTARTVPEIAEELRVTHVMEGTVRRAGDRVRIVAQLVEARPDVHVWVETYDRSLEDVFAIQTDVAARVAAALETELGAGDRERLARVPTQNLAAYDLYLRGRYEWSQRTPAALLRSLEHLERAVRLDSGFALAYAALADSCVTLAIYGVAGPAVAMERARSAAESALSHSPSCAEALTARGVVRALYNWEWEGAEADLRRAIQLKPEYPTARQWYAMNYLVPQARFEEAWSQLDRVVEVDPLSPVVKASYGVLEYYRRRGDAAVEIFEALRTEEPDFAPGRYFLGLALLEVGRPEAALAELATAVDRIPSSPETLAALAVAEARLGEKARAAERLRKLEERSARTYASPVLLAHVKLALERQESALDSLEHGLAARAADLAWIGVTPTFDPLRRDRRFEAVRRTVLGSAAP
jgi:TolB-like protein/Tfp pilus assembly protein PilF